MAAAMPDDMGEKMQLDLDGRRAVVTGASLGIGAATVRLLADMGAEVEFCARTKAVSYTHLTLPTLLLV